MSNLKVLEPLKLSNGTVIKNRIFKSAMSEAMADDKNQPTDALINLYRKWAEGGAGVIVTGNVMVDGTALGEPGNVVVEDERALGLLKSWAALGTARDTHLWMQINHPGKQSPKSMSRRPVAPSAIPITGSVGAGFNPPRALTNREVKALVKRYARTASIAKAAGFTGVQIHGAHGYLVTQFLSPRDNRRDDEYGGSLENRMRFLVEIYEGMREALGEDFPISLKLNSSDFRDGGVTEEESVAVVRILAEKGLDLIEVSGGSYESPKMFTGTDQEGYFLDYAEHLRETVEIPIVVTGGFRTLQGMEAALEAGHTSMIGIARPLSLMPDLPKRIEAGTFKKVEVERLTTGIKRLDAEIGPLLGLSYHAMQLRRIGEGKSPEHHTNGWIPLLHTIRSHGLSALSKTRR